MIVLAIDAARGGFSAALAGPDRSPSVEQIPANRALEDGLGAVARTMQRAGVAPADVQRIAVGIGPGSFTGVRIAVSYAKSLALAWKVSLVGVNTFDAIEASAKIDGPALSVVRGRKGVVSVRLRDGEFRWRGSGYVKDVLDALPHRTKMLQVLGDAEDVLPGLAERGWDVQENSALIQPTALAIAAVASDREPAASLHEVRADYGELPAVSKPASRKQ